jgi:hypothetical protein
MQYFSLIGPTIPTTAFEISVDALTEICFSESDELGFGEAED